MVECGGNKRALSRADYGRTALNKITAIIPARYGSTRFPGKPLAVISGKSLIEWTYLNSEKSGAFDRVVIATDDSRIKTAAEAFGAEVCMTKEEHESGTDRIAEAAEKLGLEPDSIVVNIQGDEPLVDAETVRRLVAPLLEEPSLRMSTLSYRIRNPVETASPNIVKVVSDRQGFAMYFSRSLIPFSESHEGVFYKHIGLYAYRKSFLVDFSRMEPSVLEKRERLEQLRAMENGFRIKVVESDTDPVEVDVPGDIEKVINAMSKG